MKKNYVIPRIRIANINLSEQVLVSSNPVSRRNFVEEGIDEEIEETSTGTSTIYVGDWDF